MADDYYKSLGVSRTASAEEISKAYRKLARKYHPDLNPDDKNAKKRFQEIQSAYDCLNDPEKRKLYDQYGPQYEQVHAAQTAQGSGSPFQRSGGGFQFDFNDVFGGQGQQGFDVNDLFRQFTGQPGSSGAGPGRGRRSGGSSKAPEDEAEITVPLATAVMGGEAEISIDRGGVAEKLRVKIPAGVQEGKKIRLRGQGRSHHGQASDLLLTVHVAPHPHFKLIGNDLELKLPVTIVEATLGAKVDVPSPGGTVTVTIPPRSQSGKRLRIKGQGVRSSSKPGDLYIELQIRTPDILSDSQVEQIKSLESAYVAPLRKDIVW
jgi:DnaJ-class molecular chaperone